MNIRRRPLAQMLARLLAEPSMNDELKAALIVARIEGDVRALTNAHPADTGDFGRGYASALRDVLALLA